MVAQLDKDYLVTRPRRALARALSYALYEGRPLLTRGRWINPWLIRRARKIATREVTTTIERPIFILGTGRSGTTVLGKILSMHPDAGWLNEPKLLWHVACPHEDLNGNYTAQPANYRLSPADATPSVRQAMHNLYADYLKTTHNHRVVDKYPELIFRTDFVRQLFPDARFLFLVRNGYATCRSIAKWSATHGHKTDNDSADWWGTNDRKWHLLVEQLVRQDQELSPAADAIAGFSDQAAMAAVEWILTMREGLRLMHQHPDDTLMVKYEHLTTSPRDSLKRILQFADLPNDEITLSYAERTLQPVAQGQQPEIPAAIRDSFIKTMHELGYQNETTPP